MHTLPDGVMVMLPLSCDFPETLLEDWMHPTNLRDSLCGSGTARTVAFCTHPAHVPVRSASTQAGVYCRRVRVSIPEHGISGDVGDSLDAVAFDLCTHAEIHGWGLQSVSVHGTGGMTFVLHKQPRPETPPAMSGEYVPLINPFSIIDQSSA